MSNVKSLDNARENKIVAEIRELLALEESAPQRAIRLGELFTQMKEGCAHGQWLPVLEAHGFNPRTAQKYMTAYEGVKYEQRSHLPPPKTVREAVARAPRKPRKVGTSTVIARAVGRAVGGADVRKVEKAMGESLKGRTFDAGEAQELQDKATAILNPDKAANDAAQGHAALPETMQVKFDRLLAVALAKQQKAQDDVFWAKVREEVKQRLPQEKADALQIMKDYSLKLKGVASQLSMPDYKKLLSVLHPDRTPTDEARAECFTIVRKLDAYMAAAHK